VLGSLVRPVFAVGFFIFIVGYYAGASQGSHSAR